MPADHYDQQEEGSKINEAIEYSHIENITCTYNSQNYRKINK